MEGKIVDFFFSSLEIFGSFDKEILGMELGVLSAERDCCGNYNCYVRVLLFQFTTGHFHK